LYDDEPISVLLRVCLVLGGPEGLLEPTFSTHAQIGTVLWVGAWSSDFVSDARSENEHVPLEHWIKELQHSTTSAGTPLHKRFDQPRYDAEQCTSEPALLCCMPVVARAATPPPHMQVASTNTRCRPCLHASMHARMPDEIKNTAQQIA
jgi:hypothetical protein